MVWWESHLQRSETERLVQDMARRCLAWNKEDIAFIKANVGKMTIREMALAIGRSSQSVKRLCASRFPTRRAFSREEIRFVRENYGFLTAKEIAEKLDQRDAWSVYAIAKKLGLRNREEPVNAYEPWLEDEDRFLFENIKDIPLDEIARKLGRTSKAVIARFYRKRNG